MQSMGAWDPSWIWGMGLAAVTTAFHAAGVVLIAQAIESIAATYERRGLIYLDTTWGSISRIVGVAISLLFLHAIESLGWAIAYVHLKALPTFADAELYSLDSMTTRGASALALASHWRLLGAVESANGMLLFGVSTAFLFYVMQRLWKKRLT